MMTDSTINFQPGDVVQLKSGGALLTVSWQDKDGVYVYYSDAQGQPHMRSNPLPAVVLKKAEPETKRKSSGVTMV